jgi:hypothetical protein
MSSITKVMDATRRGALLYVFHLKKKKKIHAWPSEDVNSHKATRYHNRERHDMHGPAVLF